MKRPLIEVVSPHVFEQTVADEVSCAIQEAIDARGKAVVALAGGTTPGGVYRALTRPPYVTSVPWQQVIVFPGDERWVPLDDPQNNGHMIRETLLHALGAQTPQFLSVPFEGNTPAGAAQLFSEQVARATGGEPIDIVLLGVGDDGHTASLFPRRPLPDGDGFAAVKDGAGVAPRITATPSLLCKARRVYFLVTGSHKANVIRRILEDPSASPDEFPALLYRRMEGRVTFFLDSSAASELTRGE